MLVIEDNAMNADVLRENLLDAGYNFHLAVNGAAGVAVANEQLPDIILMDVNLPILDGLSATRLLKRNTTTQGIPIVALTARAMAGDRESCLAAGCDDYVSKPIDVKVLLAKMKHHLDKRPQAFVDMIRRQRDEIVRASAPAELVPDGALARAQEEVASLHRKVERMESELSLARARAAALDETLGEREQQISALILERDAALSDAEQKTARANELAEELAALRAERDRAPARQGMPLPLPAVRSVVPSAVAKRSTNDELVEESQRNRKLLQRLELAQERIDQLQRQLESAPADARSLQARHEALREAFLKLHRSVAKAAEDALHDVAFGGS